MKGKGIAISSSEALELKNTQVSLFSNEFRINLVIGIVSSSL
jgi:hypothetical protein